MTERVLITAGAAGIGREFARAFTANGAKVFVCDMTTRPCRAREGDPRSHCPALRYGEPRRDRAHGAGGGRGAWRARRADQQCRHRRSDAAGRANIPRMTGTRCHRQPDCDVRRVAAGDSAPEKSKAGCIINMSSIAGRYGFANRSPYAATKWGRDRADQDAGDGARRMGHPRQRDCARCGRGRPHRPRVSGRAQISGRSLEEVKADALPLVDRRHHRSEGHRAACGVSRLRRGEVDLRQAIPIDNDRHKA